MLVGLETHRPAEELDHGVQRPRHADAIDRTAYRPVGAFQDTLDADHDVERRGGMGAFLSGFESGEKSCLAGRTIKQFPMPLSSSRPVGRAFAPAVYRSSG
jgi:hypothetical protein